MTIIDDRPMHGGGTAGVPGSRPWSRQWEVATAGSEARVPQVRLPFSSVLSRCCTPALRAASAKSVPACQGWSQQIDNRICCPAKRLHEQPRAFAQWSDVPNGLVVRLNDCLFVPKRIGDRHGGKANVLLDFGG